MTRYSKALSASAPEAPAQRTQNNYWPKVLEAAEFISPAAHSILKSLEGYGAEIALTEKGNYQLRQGTCPQWEDVKQSLLIPLRTEITNALHFARRGWVATVPPVIGETVIYCKDGANVPSGYVTFRLSELELIRSDDELRQFYDAKKVFGGELVDGEIKMFEGESLG